MKSGQKRPRSSNWHVSGWAAVLLLPIALPLAILAGMFSKPVKRTPAEVAGFIRDFMNDSGGEWDWDDFTSVSIADPDLEAIRQDAEMIALPITPEGQKHLASLFERAEMLKSDWIDAGQPD